MGYLEDFPSVLCLKIGAVKLGDASAEHLVEFQQLIQERKKQRQIESDARYRQ
jgi:hypothetical protein